MKIPVLPSPVSRQSNTEQLAPSPADTLSRNYIDRGTSALTNQAQRRETANNKMLGTKLWTKLHGMATLSTVHEPPAVQFGSTGQWSLEAVKDVVSTSAWERGKGKPENIDIIELAHAVYSIEKWRMERGQKSGPLPKLLTDPGVWECNDAIDAWLKAFHLDEAIDLDSLEKGFGAGKTGYEHRGKGILAGYGAAACTYLSMISPELLALFASTRAVMSVAQIYCDLMAGDERILRKPHEDLAHVLSLKPSKRSAVAPRMYQAQRLAKDFDEASELVAKLRSAVASDDGEMVKQLLEQADALFAKEDRVKAALYSSAAEWASKRREVPTRAAAASSMAAGVVASAVCPPAAPIALPAAIAASVAVHSAYHFSDAARRDARDKAKNHFLNRIKSYDWLDERKMTRSAIADLYGQFERKEIDRGTLREKLNQPNPFELEEVSTAMRFPVEARIGVGGIAHKLLLGRLGEQFDEEILLREKRKGEDARALGPIKFAQRRLLADLMNLLKANEAMDRASKLVPASHAHTETLDFASACLHAIRNDDVRKLLTGTMQEQGAAAACARQLNKGERLKYRLMFAAATAPAMVMGPVYGVAASVAQASAFDLAAAAGRSTVRVLPATPAFATALAVTPAVTVETMATIDRFEHGQENAIKSHETAPETQAAQAASVELKVLSLKRPVSPYDIPLDGISKMIGAGGTMPARISIVEREGHGEADVKWCIDLTGTEPYYNAPRRSLNFAERNRMRLAKAKAVGDILHQGLRAPFARWMVTRQANNTRQARHDLREAVHAARNP